MDTGLYINAYNTAVLLLNQPFQDMRKKPEKAILHAVQNVDSAFSLQGRHLTEDFCGTLLTELLDLQKQAQGDNPATSWQWPKKPPLREVYLSHHTVANG